VVIFSYNSQRTFPWLLDTFNLEALHFYKVRLPQSILYIIVSASVLSFFKLTVFWIRIHRVRLLIQATVLKTLAVGKFRMEEQYNKVFSGSQTYIVDILMTNFWVKSTKILGDLAKQIFFMCSKIKLLQFYDICSYKKLWDNKIPPPPPLLVLLLDPGSGMDKNQDQG
jgi:hypothetical protein